MRSSLIAAALTAATSLFSTFAIVETASAAQRCIPTRMNPCPYRMNAHIKPVVQPRHVQPRFVQRMPPAVYVQERRPARTAAPATEQGAWSRKVCHPLGDTSWKVSVFMGDPKDLSTYELVSSRGVSGRCTVVYGPEQSFACVTLPKEGGGERREWWFLTPEGKKPAIASY